MDKSEEATIRICQRLTMAAAESERKAYLALDEYLYKSAAEWFNAARTLRAEAERNDPYG